MQNSNSDNLQLATMRSRAFAYIIDDVIVSLIILFAYWDVVMASANNSEELFTLLATTLATPIMLLKVSYHTFFVWYFGATIGKMVTKIRVIDANHWGRVNIFQAFLRAVGRFFSEIFFYVGFLIGFFNDGRRTFHDFTGKTLVVNA